MASGTFTDAAGNTNTDGSDANNRVTIAVDTVVPTVLTFSPSDAATDVLVGSNIVLTFSELIQKGSGLIQIRVGSETGTIVESFDAASSTRLSFSGSTLTIDPTNDLASGTQYFMTFAAGTVRDLAGNAYAGITTYDFTTVASGGGGITGTPNNDLLTGTSAGESINGLAGDDTITGGGGNDTMNGGDGSDLYIINAPSEHAVAEIADNGTSGTDEVRFTSTTANATLVLFAADTGIERVVIGTGTQASAVTTGTTALNVDATAVTSSLTMIGNAGTNALTGGLGNDTYTGGTGADTFVIKNGTDSITDLGAGGADIIQVSAGATLNATVTTAWTATSGTTNAGTVNITTNGLAVNLSAVTGGTNGYTVTDTGGATSLIGSSKNDSLNGGLGNDTISAGAGNDVVQGGKGADSVTGGAGSDTFKFSAGDSGQTTAFDIITDFAKGASGTGDIIDYSANMTIGGSAAAATSSQASVNQATGIASFAANSGTNLSDALADITARFTAATDSAGEYALFRVNGAGNYYLFISDGTAGLGINDIVVQLTGVTAITTTGLSGGNLGIIA